MMQLGAYTQKEIQKIYEKFIGSGTRNLLLIGGVGVGKTLYAKIIANNLINGCGPNSMDYKNGSDKKEQITLFSFGPSYTYENFIYGTTIKSEKGNLFFETGKQRFLEFCKEAQKSIDSKYVAIFDDMNRADISKTLGELLSSLESNDVGNEMRAGNERIELPDNLYIIATVNPLIGKEKLDYAWMRRFLHYEILADERHFGFQWDGSDAGNEYRGCIEKAWRDAYIYDENAPEKIKNTEKNGNINEIEIKGKWELWNQKISYDDNGTINGTGYAFLRRYQWEIYMHIKIMYERYWCEVDNIEKRNQYLPGHGCFMTYNPNRSYGDNLILFHRQLQCVIVPILEKQLQDGLLEKNVQLDVKCFKDIYSGEKKIVVKENGYSDGRMKDTLNLYRYLSYMIELDITGAEMYMFIFTGLLLRRKAGLNHRICYLCERKELINEYKATKGAQTQLSNCHHNSVGWKVGNIYEIQTPVQINNNGLVEDKNKQDTYNNILRLCKGVRMALEERKTEMSKSILNNTNDKIKIMNDLGIKQLILQGPPGTSKTYGAKYDIIAPAIKECSKDQEIESKKQILENSLISNYGFRNDETEEKPIWDKPYGWDMVQFHPSYCYEDFVRGITVSTNDNQVVYETVNKILGNICTLAQYYEKSDEFSDSMFFLIIDEINRADIATVFGELIYALECRGEEVSIPYAINGNYKLRIPKNLYIIGTMNTADKSIGTIDYAIRRRFLFFDCLPDANVVSDYIEKYINKFPQEVLAEKQSQVENVKNCAINMLNNVKRLIDCVIEKNYNAKDLYIGHTYFLVKSVDELKIKLQYQILPIIREYVENGNLVVEGNNEGWEKFKNGFQGQNNSPEFEKFKKYLQGKLSAEETIEDIYRLLIIEG